MHSTSELIKNIKVDNKSGKVVVALTPGDANQILATTSSGKVIRTHIDSIREIARVGRGVKVMSVDEKEKVVAVALHNEDDEERNILLQTRIPPNLQTKRKLKTIVFTTHNYR